MLFAMRLTGWRSRASGTVKCLKCANLEFVYQNPSILLTLSPQDQEAPMLSIPLSDDSIGVMFAVCHSFVHNATTLHQAVPDT